MGHSCFAAAYEQRVFHFGMPDALFQLFPLPSPYLLQKIADDVRIFP